jgi:hypothetical protein
MPALIAASDERAARRFLEFFAANIRNPHTRRAHGRAVAEFLTWRDDQGVPSVAAVQSLYLAAWIEASIAYGHDVAWHTAGRVTKS